MVLEKDERISILRKISQRKRIKIYLVGGFIRDCLLGRLPVDMDYIVEKDAEKIAQEFAQKIRGKFIIMGKPPKTSYRVAARGNIIDFVDAVDGILVNDLSKRDFTINAISLEINSWKLFDPFKGIEDIDNKIIREVSPQSLKDDPIRILRAVRYAATIEDMKIDDETYFHMVKESPNIIDCAFERFAEEVNKMFLSFNPHRGITLLIRTRLIANIFCSLMSEKEFNMASIEQDEDKFIREILPQIKNASESEEYRDILRPFEKAKALWISALLIFYLDKFDSHITKIKKILKHMRFSAKDVSRIYNVVAGTLELCDIAKEEIVDDDKLKLFIGKWGKDFVVMQNLFEGLYLLKGISEEKKKKTSERLASIFIDDGERLLSPPNLVNGNDVKKILGMDESGTKIGMVLKKIRELQFIGRIKNREEALEFIRKNAGT
ncbi:MAG: CCA tRNA nucleotidyltransferase [Candidatus Schekmanbacteria bacterium]|nr:MAG: CCA tRNA nucleotidyltransferase [Candidatus Schekmanbacteria bacterium]